MRTAPTALIAAAAAVVLTVGLGAPAGAAKAHEPYLIDPSGPAADLVFPEGIATDKHSFYVGSTTDGTIYRGALAGTTATPFLLGGQDGRTSAIGLKVSDGYLFVAGGGTGRFFVYDVASRALVGSFAVPAHRRRDLPQRRDGRPRRQRVHHRLAAPGALPDRAGRLRDRRRRDPAGLPRLHRHRRCSTSPGSST